MSTFWIFITLNLMMISVFCLTPDEIEAQKTGWNIDPTTQYHIQTDEGPERYFRFQTLNGQFRKEKRLEDGTVVGTEGWLDPLGYLRIKDYIADHQGYRILKSKTIYVGRDRPIDDAVAISRRVPAQSGILAKPRRPLNPFRRPALQELPGNSIETNPIKSYRGYIPPSSTIYPNFYSTTPSPITIDETYNELSKPISNYISPSYQFQPPYNRRYRNPSAYSKPSLEVLPPADEDDNQQLKQRSGISVNQESSYGIYRPESRRYRAAIASGKFNNTRQIRGRKPNYSIARSDNEAKGDSPVYYVSKAPRSRQARLSQYSSSTPEYEFPPYEGDHTTADGFQYYLKTHYHEEEQKPDKSVGSFGYVDPFGIRRVVYYKADENGFVHKKNNRYVGHNATPYDPLPLEST